MRKFTVPLMAALAFVLSAPGKNFKDQKIVLNQPMAPRFKTLASSVVLEFEAAGAYRQLEELGLAIAQELQRGQVRVAGPGEPAQSRLRVRITAYTAAHNERQQEQESRNVEVPDGNTKVCRERSVTVTRDTGGGQLSAIVTVDEAASRAVFTAPVTAGYRFSNIRSVDSRQVKPGDMDPCSGLMMIARRPYQDRYASSPSAAPAEIELYMRQSLARDIAATLVKTDRLVTMRLSAEDKLLPAASFLVTQRWPEAIRAIPPCERGVAKGDCLYTRGLAREGAAYAEFVADPSQENAVKARTALTEAVADYEAALAAEPRERVIAENAPRVRNLLAEWNQFIDYTAWLKNAVPPATLPDRSESGTRQSGDGTAGAKGTQGGERAFTTSEQAFRQALRAEFGKREPAGNDSFIDSKVSEASFMQPPIPREDARKIVAEEVRLWTAAREKRRIYREKVELFLEEGKVTPATLRNLKLWEDSLGLDAAIANGIREDVMRGGQRRVDGGGKRQ